MSHEISPLTPLEERVFQRVSSNGPIEYNVFDDDEVLGVDDAGEQLTPREQHGRRIDSVIDKYGNRIASRSKRLARIVAQRRRRSSSDGGAGAQLLYKNSIHGSSSTGAASGAPSPMAAAPAVISASENGSGSAERRSRSRGRRKHKVGQSPQHMFLRVPDSAADNVDEAYRASLSDPGSAAANQIYDFPMATDEPKNADGDDDKPPRKGAGFISRIWSAIHAFAMPGGYNRFGTRDGRAFTEYIGFLLTFALASVAFIMWGVLAPKAICSTDQTFTLDNVESRKFVAANGIVSDFTLSQSSFGRMMHGYIGYDISSVFPLISQVNPEMREFLPSSTATLLSKCVSSNEAEQFIEHWRSESTLYSGGDTDNFPERCPFPQSPQTSGADCLTSSWPQFLSSKVGVLKINTTEVTERHTSATTSWVIIDDYVYDVSMYVTYASDEVVHNGTVDTSRSLRRETMFLPENLTRLFISNSGQDISTQFHALSLKDEALYKQCMDSLFLRGTTLTTKSPFACANTNIVAWVTFGLYFLVVFVRFAVAEIYAQVRARRVVLAVDEDSAASLEQAPSNSVLVVVPCFNEPIETLTRTIQGIARSVHPDSQTLLWVINDGNPDVLDSILRVLSHSGHASDPKFYGAYGGGDVGGGSFSAARVYAGFYECGRHRIAYVVAAKEAYQGRVDSLMMVLNLFRSVRADSRHSPSSSTSTTGAVSAPAPKTIFLDEELEAQMTLLGHPPSDITYCLMLDGAIMIDPLAITQFVARMQRYPSIIALSGTLYPVGRPATLPQLLHFFEFYLHHFVSPICESLSNVTCPLDQLFTMYRVRLDDGSRCLGDDNLVSSIDSLMKTSVRCRHRTWPANDCLLVPRMVRRFPQCRWAFESNGRAEVEVTQARMVAFDPYERQWFRTRLVTLFDIQRGRMLKRTWPIMFAHMLFPFMVPAAACMLYLELVISIFGDNPAIVVSELTGAFLAATVILFLLARKWHLAIYFLVYSALAVPFYHVWIPATAFFSMNRVWYTPEQLKAQRAAAEANVQKPANFEAIKNNYLRRLSSAKERNANADLSSDSEAEQESFVEHPSDSSRRHYRDAITGGGLGLTFGNGGGGGGGGGGEDGSAPPPLTPSSLNFQSVVVSDALLTSSHAALRQILSEYPNGLVEPESAEFYAVCERALSILIPAYPSSSVAELAVAVNRAVDEILAMPSSPVSQKRLSPMPPIPKFTKQGSGSGYLGSGRPVSIILEEESDNEHH
ncbi:hypothetical protein GGI15_003277 [Coemansia interrupta]|uniref:chitin synthase n=1 Tax=Coemansia interrupta TaxID=1126814 RepID=A0A9W8LGY4_9FUNG|nr:hypothetical protein GGI15_003277 [Coemansia interrupta]